MKTRYVLIFALFFSLTRCVEKELRIYTEPREARVVIGGVDLGTGDPENDFVKIWKFDHYGTYPMLIYVDQPRLRDPETGRTVSYDSLKTSYTIERPWYEYFPFEPIAEVLWPWTVYDIHTAPIQKLQVTKLEKLDTDEKLLARANQMRQEAAEPIDMELGHPYKLAGVMAAIIVVSFVINGF